MADSVITRKTKIRMIIFGVLIAVAFSAVIIGRLFYLQVYAGSEYQQQAQDQQLRVTTLTPSRGSIYDRNMNVLAQSADVSAIILSPATIASEEEKKLIADTLSDILDISRESILEKAEMTASYYQVIKRRVEEKETEKVRAFLAEHDIRCVSIVKDIKRYYPYGNFLAHVLGFTGTDNQGLAGLEAMYDAYLTGTSGRVLSAKNAWGDDMPYTYEEMYAEEDGYSLILTIDEGVQHFVEKYLEIAIDEYHVEAGAVGLVMDVDTGGILALAIKNDYDPNDPFTIFDEDKAAEIAQIEDEEERAQAYSDAQQAQWRNKAISDTYEPGSVFKSITASSALEEGVVTLEDNFYCGGSLTILDRTIHCDRTTGHGQESFLQGFGNSCNPVFMEVGARLGAENFLKYFEAFGFTEKTNIDLPGEANPVQGVTYHSLSTLRNAVSLAVCSFGQSFKVTPIQMATAVCAVVNGGKLVQPHVVSSIIDSEGSVVRSYNTEVKRQVISQEVSDTMLSMLEFVVTDGGGKNVKLAGYRIGGKSGTSEKLDLVDEYGNSLDERIASFVAVAPADDPKYLVMVLLDQPHPDNGLRYGSTLAAPVCREILADMLPYLGYEPTYSEEEAELIDVTTPYLVDSGLLDAQGKLRELDLEATIKGEGSTIVRQVPEAGMPIPKGGTVILYTEENMVSETGVVPNVIGMTPSQANAALVNAGFNIRVAGSGVSDSSATATKQSVEPSTELEQGTVIEVEFVSKIVVN